MTLVELMVVVVIITVMAGLFVPQFAGSLGASRLQSSAQQLLLAARAAQDHAVTRRRICRIVLDTEQQAFGVEHQADPEADPQQFEPMRAGGQGNFKSPCPLRLGVKFGNVLIESRAAQAPPRETEPRMIYFMPSGESDAAVVQVTDGMKTYSLVVEPVTGRAVLRAGAIEELPTDQEDLDA